MTMMLRLLPYRSPWPRGRASMGESDVAERQTR